jgi:Galactose oxidase, central domain
VLAFGGYGKHWKPSNECILLDPNNKSWRSLAQDVKGSSPLPRINHT